MRLRITAMQPVAPTSYEPRCKILAKSFGHLFQYINHQKFVVVEMEQQKCSLVCYILFLNLFCFISMMTCHRNNSIDQINHKISISIAHTFTACYLFLHLQKKKQKYLAMNRR